MDVLQVPESIVFRTENVNILTGFPCSRINNLLYPDLEHHFDSEAPLISKMHIYKLHSRKVSIFEQWDHEYC